MQAESRDDLRAKLQVASCGVVFTTIQKFMPDERGEAHPLLSTRENIVVIADEAHRSQYDCIDGFARHLRDALPNASFIGFTGTPIESTDKNTRAVCTVELSLPGSGARCRPTSRGAHSILRAPGDWRWCLKAEAGR